MSDDKPIWAIVELMGHVRLAGRLTEEEKFGAKMGRLDIPQGPNPQCLACKGTGICGDVASAHYACVDWDCCNRFVTQFFGGGSVYRITITSEEVARHVAKGSASAPISPWDFPKQLTVHHSPPEEEDDDDDDDDDSAVPGEDF